MAVMIHVDKDNNYAVEMSAIQMSTFCNGAVIKVSELANASLPAALACFSKGAWGYIKCDMKNMHSSVYSLIDRYGFHLLTESTFKLLDKPIVTHLHIPYLVTNGTGTVIVLANRARIAKHPDTLLKMVAKTPKVSALGLYGTRYKGNFKGSKKTLNFIKGMIINDKVKLTRQIIADNGVRAIDCRVRNVFTGSCSPLAGLTNVGSIVHTTANTVYYQLTNAPKQPLIDTYRTYGLGCGTLYKFLKSEEDYWAIRARYLFRHTTKAAINCITDNIEWSSPGNNGAMIRHFIELNEKGIYSMQTIDDDTLYFAVIPHITGNTNHGNRGTAMAFVSRKPITMTTIT